MKKAKPVTMLVLTMAAVLLAAPMAGADANPEAALRAAFRAGWNGGDAITWVVPNDRAVQVAAPAVGFENRIPPWMEGQVLCTDTVYGTWVTWITEPGEPKEVLDYIQNEFELDGELLDVERTATLRCGATYHDGNKYFCFSEGVPVLGTLEPGPHTLTWRAFLFGELFIDVTVTIEVEDCG